jgi:hypothetical protein
MTTTALTTYEEDKLAPTMAYLECDIPPRMTLAEYRRARTQPTNRRRFRTRRNARP